MEYITKKEFAERCGVTTVTVFNWIKSNRHGITRYTSKQGIDTAIFDDPAWSNEDRTQETTLQEVQLQHELEIAKAEFSQMQIMYDGVVAERDAVKSEAESIRSQLVTATAERDEARRDADLSRALLVEKDERIAELKKENDRIAGELEQERIASKETRQLMHQQQALTAMQAQRRPLLAAIFPKWYDKKHPVEDDGSSPSGSDAQL